MVTGSVRLSSSIKCVSVTSQVGTLKTSLLSMFECWLVKISFNAVWSFGTITYNSFGITFILPSNILSSISDVLTPSIGALGLVGISFL